jgi:hypothetical protein
MHDHKMSTTAKPREVSFQNKYQLYKSIQQQNSSVELEVRPKIREYNGLQQIKPQHPDENFP